MPILLLLAWSAAAFSRPIGTGPWSPRGGGCRRRAGLALDGLQCYSLLRPLGMASSATMVRLVSRRRRRAGLALAGLQALSRSVVVVVKGARPLVMYFDIVHCSRAAAT
ncbi:hypothetical protein PHYPSEUDO_011189 [Phytophthora pseudosyringae]|uniref:Secreted protein n=1 Tax=Phytophthora pseudosyringae TaxID=221518 RepID=A0A8T1VC23_9STRA|nr:hypothetical protein PHYPSEUDO_011189 [Phytophthora pseudosyringae]